MIDGRSVFAIIPARGGSKGVRGKNIRPVNGLPLLAWSIRAANQSSCIDRLIVSSDDEAIIEVARAHGCEAPFVRPSELSADETPGIDPVLHALDVIPGYDIVVLLQPTSPLRTASDIDQALRLMIERRAPACVSLTPVLESPFLMYSLLVDQRLHALMEDKGYTRRQDFPPVYRLNGAVYAADITWLRINKTFVTRDTVGYVMPHERSLDIDSEADFLILENQKGSA